MGQAWFTSGFSLVNRSFGTEEKTLETGGPELLKILCNGIEFTQMMDITQGVLTLLIMPIS